MIIKDIYGNVLKWFDEWDLSSVAKAERWIENHGFVIFSCSNENGRYVITVRRYKHVPDCEGGLS